MSSQFRKAVPTPFEKNNLTGRVRDIETLLAQRLGRELSPRESRWCSYVAVQELLDALDILEPNVDLAALQTWLDGMFAKVAVPTASELRTRRTRGQDGITDAQWEALKRAYGHRCAYCGKRARYIVPACRPCNRRKQASLLTIEPPLRMLV